MNKLHHYHSPSSLANAQCKRQEQKNKLSFCLLHGFEQTRCLCFLCRFSIFNCFRFYWNGDRNGDYGLSENLAACAVAVGVRRISIARAISFRLWTVHVPAGQHHFYNWPVHRMGSRCHTKLRTHISLFDIFHGPLRGAVAFRVDLHNDLSGFAEDSAEFIKVRATLWCIRGDYHLFKDLSIEL